MKHNEYRCAQCKGVFEKGWSEEEAVAELNETFPGATVQECSVICEDCYQEMKEMFE